jgi:hypothetical protein
MTDASMFDWGVMRESVHELDYGHKQAATTASVVAGGFEAGDRSGDVDARIIGLGGGAALRRQTPTRSSLGVDATGAPRRSRPGCN